MTEDNLNTRRAVTLLSGGLRAHTAAGLAFPWEMLLPFVIDAIRRCLQSPDAAHAYLVWRPYGVFDWFGGRLARHRRSVAALVRRSFAGSDADFADTMVALWASVDAGEVSERLIDGLWKENK